MTIPPYPLAWPDHQPRTKTRKKSQFRTTLAGAIKNVEGSIRRFGDDSGKRVSSIIVTSNATMFTGKVDDPGVSVWFEWDGAQRCIAVDRYAKVEENLQAIHHVIEARRTELRHAGIHAVRTTFRGMTALPPPPAAPGIERASCWSILGIDTPTRSSEITATEIDSAWKAQHRKALSDAEKVTLNTARDEALSKVFG